MMNWMCEKGYSVLRAKQEIRQAQEAARREKGTKPDGQRIYVQASYIIADETTREREFGNLRAIKDNYPKYVISMTPLLTRNDDNGITHLHLRHFLHDGL